MCGFSPTAPCVERRGVASLWCPHKRLMCVGSAHCLSVCPHTHTHTHTLTLTLWCWVLRVVCRPRALPGCGVWPSPERCVLSRHPVHPFPCGILGRRSFFSMERPMGAGGAVWWVARVGVDALLDGCGWMRARRPVRSPDAALSAG
jgi:hypothetical protein